MHNSRKMSNFARVIYLKISVIIIKIMKTKKLALSFVLIASAAITSNAQQLPNSSFEEAWVDCKPWTSTNDPNKPVISGKTPTSWTVSHVIGMGGTGATQVGESVIGYNEGNGVKVVNKVNPWMKSQKVPGFITLGTSWATATVKFSWGGIKVENADGGTFGGIKFTYRPDAVSFWYKDIRVDNKENPTVVAYLWNGTVQQADVPGEVKKGAPQTTIMTDRERNILGMKTAQGGAVSGDYKLIAKIDQYLTGNVANWTEQVIDFNYVDQNAAPEKFNIIFAAGDYWSTSPVEGNELYIDDVNLLYYSRLSDLKVNGATVAGFDSKKFEYNFLEKVPALSSVSATKMGNAPKIVSTELAANGSDILVTVANQAGANDFDGKNTHTYTLSYMNEELDGIFTVNTQNPNGSLSVEEQQQSMKLFFKKNDNGKYTVIIPNTSKYGTITVDGVVSEDGKNFEKQTFEVELAGGKATVAIQGIANENDFLYSYSVTLNGKTRILTFTNNSALSGVESVEGLSEKVVAKAGSIEVCGVNGSVNVYAVDGRLVKSVAVNGEATIELANGLYIVRTPKTATKVLVK